MCLFVLTVLVDVPARTRRGITLFQVMASFQTPKSKCHVWCPSRATSVMGLWKVSLKVPPQPCSNSSSTFINPNSSCKSLFNYLTRKREICLTGHMSWYAFLIFQNTCLIQILWKQWKANFPSVKWYRPLSSLSICRHLGCISSFSVVLYSAIFLNWTHFSKR